MKRQPVLIFTCNEMFRSYAGCSKIAGETARVSVSRELMSRMLLGKRHRGEVVR